MQAHGLRRRRSFVAPITSRLVGLFRRWSLGGYRLGRGWLESFFGPAPRHKNQPMFPSARLELYPLEDRYHPNDPLGMLHTQVLGVLAAVGLDLSPALTSALRRGPSSAGVVVVHAGAATPTQAEFEGHDPFWQRLTGGSFHLPEPEGGAAGSPDLHLHQDPPWTGAEPSQWEMGSDLWHDPFSGAAGFGSGLAGLAHGPAPAAGAAGLSNLIVNPTSGGVPPTVLTTSPSASTSAPADTFANSSAASAGSASGIPFSPSVPSAAVGQVLPRVAPVPIVSALPNPGTPVSFNGPSGGAQPLTPGASNNIIEYTIPSSGAVPSYIVTGSDNNLWVTWGSPPSTPLLKVSPLGATGGVPGGTITRSNYIVNGPGGLWYTGIQPNGTITLLGGTSGLVGLMTTSGTDTQWALASNDPRGITVGPDGNLWFTEFDLGKIAKITTGGAVTEYAIPTANSGPEGITLGANNELWFTESSTNKIGEVTTGGSFTEFSVPTPSSQPFAITEGPDGNIWFTEYSKAKIGRCTRTGTITEFNGPAGKGINSGPDGNLWFTDTGGDFVDSITPYGAITTYTIPTHLSGPVGITTGPDGSIWFVEQTANKIAKLTDVLGLGGGAVTNPGGGAVPTPVGQTPPYPVDGTTTDPGQGTSVPIGELSVAPGSGNVTRSHTLDCFLAGGS